MANPANPNTMIAQSQFKSINPEPLRPTPPTSSPVQLPHHSITPPPPYNPSLPANCSPSLVPPPYFRLFPHILTYFRI